MIKKKSFDQKVSTYFKTSIFLMVLASLLSFSIQVRATKQSASLKKASTWTPPLPTVRIYWIDELGVHHKFNWKVIPTWEWILPKKDTAVTAPRFRVWIHFPKKHRLIKFESTTLKQVLSLKDPFQKIPENILGLEAPHLENKATLTFQTPLGKVHTVRFHLKVIPDRTLSWLHQSCKKEGFRIEELASDVAAFQNDLLYLVGRCLSHKKSVDLYLFYSKTRQLIRRMKKHVFQESESDQEKWVRYRFQRPLFKQDKETFLGELRFNRKSSEDFPHIFRLYWNPNPQDFTRHRFSVSLGETYLTYHQTDFPLYRWHTPTLKIQYAYYFYPPDWSFGVNSYFNLFPFLKSPSNVTIRFLGINAKLGYRLPFIEEPWSLSFQLGFFIQKIFVSGSAAGYTTVIYPLMLPLVTFHWSPHVYQHLYVKYVPMSQDPFNFFTLVDRELAVGTGWHFLMGKTTSWDLSLDFSNIQFTVSPATRTSNKAIAKINSLSLSTGFSW